MSELRPRTNGSTKTLGIARHGRLRKQGPWATIMSFVAAGLAVVLVSGGALAAIVVSQLNSNIDVVTLVGETEGPPPSIGEFEGGFNMLIVGSDKCEDDDGCRGKGGRGSSNLNDVTMLLHVSADQTNAVAVSFPRDLVVPIPSCPDPEGGRASYAMSGRPINETLYYGGLACTVLTVENLTGLDIQFAGLITFNGVIEMTNAVGGVDVCLTDAVKDKYTGLDVPAGYSNLAGWDALAFLRSRHGVGDGSDLTRISSQQVYLSSLVRTLKSSDTLSDLFKVYSIAQAATSNMELSQGLANTDTLVSIAMALKDIPLENVTFVQFPGTTGGTGIYAGKVAPVQSRANELFALIKADTKFNLDAAGDGRGSQLDPNAPVVEATPLPSGSAAPPVVDSPVLSGVRGQTAADYTCSIAN
ncbi:MAG: LCP family protein [Microbacteriaceae bacterium]